MNKDGSNCIAGFAHAVAAAQDKERLRITGRVYKTFIESANVVEICRMIYEVRLREMNNEGTSASTAEGMAAESPEPDDEA